MFPSSEKTRAVLTAGLRSILRQKESCCCAWRTGPLKRQWRSANSNCLRPERTPGRMPWSVYHIASARQVARLHRIRLSHQPTLSDRCRNGPRRCPRRPAFPPGHPGRGDGPEGRDQRAFAIAADCSRGNRDREAWLGDKSRQPPRTSPAPGPCGMELERRDISGSDLPESRVGAGCLALWR